MKNLYTNPISPVVIKLILPALGIGLTIYMLLSLRWRMEHDIPILNYAAFLHNTFHLSPYKDIFETSMPLTFMFHIAYTKLFGYSDLGYRIADMVMLCISMYGTFLLFSAGNKFAGIFAAILWGITFLNFGKTMGLQKDYVGFVPLIFASWLLVRKNKIQIKNAILLGCLVCLAAWVKPQLLIWILPAAIYILFIDRNKGTFKQLFFFILAFLFLSALIISWLISMDSFTAFGEIFFKYNPLHIQMNGQLYVENNLHNKILYILNGLLEMLQSWNTICIVAGVYAIFFIRKQNPVLYKAGIFFLLNLFFFWLYPAVSGQFWDYHLLPFFYFSQIVFAFTILLFLNGNRIHKIFFVLLFICNSWFQLSDALANYQPNLHPKKGLVDELASYINNNTSPQDLIQPLDWTGGALHAMYMTKRRIATKFLCDYHFYHHISDPYIKNLRAEFINEMDSVRPKLVIDILTKPRPLGFDTSQEFSELSDFLKKNYIIIESNKVYCIYKLK